jgi:hypothetical protein
VSDLWIVEIVHTTTHPPQKESGWLRQIVVINGIIFFASTTRCYVSVCVVHKLQADTCYDVFHVTYPLILPLVQPFQSCKHHIARTYIPSIMYFLNK